MQNFTPLAGLLGGLMIGLSAAAFLLLAGRISGISGILEDALSRPPDGTSWRFAYLAGLPIGAFLVAALAPGLAGEVRLSGGWPLVAAGGLLVGFGTRLSGGCTSGHGVCGIPRLSPRSILATLVFMATAAMTVFVMRHVL